ncbi:hypothetical protein [Actinoplanes sp. L3-i22]|nr:hypothetical protein [Actinoplanes sp. L3-i22]
MARRHVPAAENQQVIPDRIFTDRAGVPIAVIVREPVEIRQP